MARAQSLMMGALQLQGSLQFMTATISPFAMVEKAPRASSMGTAPASGPCRRRDQIAGNWLMEPSFIGTIWIPVMPLSAKLERLAPRRVDIDANPMTNVTQPSDFPTTTLTCAPQGSKRTAPLRNRPPFVAAPRHIPGWVVLTACAIAMAGCHKKANVIATPANQQAQPETPTSPRQPVQVQSEASDASKALEGEVHPLMTYQLHVFVEQKGRLPTDFAELARTRLDAVPRTPPGMTWAIDRVTQEVKLVKK